MMNTDLLTLANHLWQSTLFAGAVWILTLALKKNRAAVRYWLWLAASVKFLVPFSLLIGIGGQLHWRSAPAITPARISVVMDQVSQPFLIYRRKPLQRLLHRLPVCCCLTCLASGFAVLPLV